MAISPPAKVKNTDSSVRILASGIDSLYLAIDVHWDSTEHFDYLADLKKTAKDERRDVPGYFAVGETQWPFNVKPSGGDGYEWFIHNREFFIKIGSWKRPIARPSMLVRISSETLWHLGPQRAIDFLIQIFQSQGGTRITIKPSRVDLCLDALIPEEIWTMELCTYAVTRSASMGMYFNRRKLTGLSIGKGKISARLYDKPLEIRQQSKKKWMYDIWGLKAVPDGQKIIRVEFQLRREKLTEVAIKDIVDLFQYLDNLWVYCSRKWLKFSTNPGKHHTQRKVFPWWVAVQNGFQGAQDKNPLIRSKAIHFDIEQHRSQAIGHLRVLTAALIDDLQLDGHVPAEIGDGMLHVKNFAELQSGFEAKFAESVKEKIASNHRSILRHLEAEDERESLNLPTSHRLGGHHAKHR